MYLHCTVLPLESDVDFDLQLESGSACTCAAVYEMVAAKLQAVVQQVSYGEHQRIAWKLPQSSDSGITSYQTKHHARLSQKATPCRMMPLSWASSS